MKMRLNLIALAALGLAGGADANRLTPADAVAATLAGNVIYVSGSSSLRFSEAWSFLSACQPGTVAIFGNADGTSPGSIVRGYACTLGQNIAPASGGGTAFSGGTNVVFNKFDGGGSIMGIQPLVNKTALSYLNYNACTPTGVLRTGSYDVKLLDYTCPQGNNVVPQIGVSDVEAATIQHKNNLAKGTVAVSTTGLTRGVHSVAMSGVVASLPLYRALQAAQGLTQDDTEANAPSLSSAFLATVESGTASTILDTGFNALIPSDGSNRATDSNAQAVTFCSRANGSGTKAMHNVFALSNPCSTQGAAYAGDSSPNPAVNEAGNNDIVLHSDISTGYVVSCMQAASVDASKTTTGLYKNWAIGMVGAENDPGAGTSADEGWRYVKVGGVYPSLANAQIGNYPMTYENYMYWPFSGLPRQIVQFATWLRDDAVTPLALFSRTEVHTYIGVRSALLAAATVTDITNPRYAGVKGYIARTMRTGNSCSPQMLVQ